MNPSLLQAFGDRLVLRYDKAYLDAMLQTDGGLFIPEKGLKGQLLRQGELKAEVAVVVSVGENIKQVKAGDTVACNYLIAFDQTNGGERTLNGHYIWTDEDGNEYRWATIKDIYAIVYHTDGVCDDLVPLKGQVFCDVPPETPETKTEGGIILAAKEQETEKNYRTTVDSMSDADALEFDFLPGDTVLCSGNSDIPIRIFDKRLIRVPIEKVLGYFEETPVATASVACDVDW